MTSVSIAAKIFPGNLEIPGIPFTEDLKDKQSEEFNRTSANVTQNVSFSLFVLS